MRFIRSVRLVLALCFSIGLGRAEILISEIMYHPVEEPAFATEGVPALDLSGDVHEYVELHNPSAAEVSLHGWLLSGGARYVFPATATIPAGGYRVVARHPDRLRAVPAYQLEGQDILGPWDGGLDNDGETVRLVNEFGQIVDSVEYSPRPPWPVGADAFGAGDDWTRLQKIDHQYRGRSLERVSFTAPSNDPANWLASPIPGEPSPGRPNHLVRAVPLPVVAQWRVSQVSEGQRIVRPGEPARLECLFTSAEGLSNVRVEYFVDLIDFTNELRQVQAMLPAGLVGQARFLADLPGQVARSVVRYRIRADRGDGEETVLPRADDPFAWHAYFVPQIRTSSNPIYDLLISSNSIRNLARNMADNPNSGYRPRSNTVPNGRWNWTEPAIFAHDGTVYDVQARYNGSFYRRSAGRQSYKVEFPRYARFQGQPTLLITDKDSVTIAAHAIFRAAGLPTSHTRWVDLYVNRASRLTRLQIEEHDELLLEDYHRRMAFLRGEAVVETPGRIFKSSGILDNTIPYGRGDGSRLSAASGFSELRRYEWVYSLKNDDWRGYGDFKDMINGVRTARGANAAQSIPALREYFSKAWDTNAVLTYLSVRNWMSTWDDTVHNYFLWQKSDGRWSMLPWDFDSDMGSGGESGPSVNIYRGEAGNSANTHGTHIFKDSLYKAFRQEYKEKLFFLNNTLLHPDNLRGLGITSGTIPTFARSRLTNVNRQVNLGAFERPVRPTNAVPANGRRVSPMIALSATPYAHTTNPAPAHVATTWEIRRTGGNYEEPLLHLTSSNQLLSFDVPAGLLKLNETYLWKCTYVDAVGRPSVPSVETSFTIGFERAPGEVRLNEFMADNDGAVSNDGRFSDWIELHNPGSTPQDLTGWGLTDDWIEPGKFTFPPNTVIPAGGFLVVWCDSQRNDPGLHAGFALSVNGEAIALYAPSPEGWLLKDAVEFGPQIRDLSVGRLAGSDEWLLNQPTPGEANQSYGLGSPAKLKINEWLANGIGQVDWLEVYNPEPFPVALFGLAMTDNLAAPLKSPFPRLSFLAGGGFLRLIADGRAEPFGNELNFQLNAHGGSIGLLESSGRAVDVVLYGRQPAGLAEGRVPDGSPNLLWVGGAGSPGLSNTVDRDADGLPDAWEAAFGIDSRIGPDGWLDADGDGSSNLQELLTGTDPLDDRSFLEITPEHSPADPKAGLRLWFEAAPGQSYTVQFREIAAGGAWQKLGDQPAYPARRRVAVADPAFTESSGRYYRVVTPAQP